MAVWDEFKVVLARLRDEQPAALMLYPMPEVDEGRQPPFVIRLAPWAAATAAELHRQFGDAVGALAYPPGREPPGPPAAGPAPDLLDPHEIAAGLDGPARPGLASHPARRLGNLRHAHPRLTPLRLVPQADPDPAPHHHRLNHGADPEGNEVDLRSGDRRRQPDTSPLGG
jgi:hypothetical protein